MNGPYELKEPEKYVFDHYLILFRDSDTWKPGHVVYDSKQAVIEAANQYSRSGETILIIPAIAIPGQSPEHAFFKVTVRG